MQSSGGSRPHLAEHVPTDHIGTLAREHGVKRVTCVEFTLAHGANSCESLYVEIEHVVSVGEENGGGE